MRSDHCEDWNSLANDHAFLFRERSCQQVVNDDEECSTPVEPVQTQNQLLF